MGGNYMTNDIIKPMPFEGKPVLHCPRVFGASPDKEILWKIPATGKRPLSFLAKLPEGLTVNDGIVSGKVKSEGDYPVTITVKNDLGEASQTVIFKIHDRGVMLTPLMGWCSWNAYRDAVTQEDILTTADFFISSGLADYGYRFVNVDSTWQGHRDENGVIVPNEKFPDMEKMCDEIHKKGLCCGIYATPMRNAWGWEGEKWGLPGVTDGEMDERFPKRMGGIGLIHHEAENARKWAEWGFDYLKYDWDRCEPENAMLMYDALGKTGRDFGLCFTIHACMEYKDTWLKTCNSWRDNYFDSDDDWDILTKVYNSGKPWHTVIREGHFFDYDMLETGYMMDRENRFSKGEQMFCVAMRAFFNSPLQISCDVKHITEFDMALLCNENILSIQRDTYSPGARLREAIIEKGKYAEVYDKPLNDGKTAVAFFNLGDEPLDMKYKLTLGAKADVLNAWTGETFTVTDIINQTVNAHEAVIYILS